MHSVRKATFMMSCILVLVPSLAYAYVGPGAGLSAIGSLLSLLAAIGLGIVGFIWYPMRRLLNRMRSPKTKAGDITE